MAAGLNPFRRPEPPLVPGMDGVARQADGALVHFFRPAPPYGAFAERVPLAGSETVPLPVGLDLGRAAALGIPGVAAWTALAGTAALRPGESVLVLGANGQVARLAAHAAAGELTVDYRETELKALPAIWADFADGRAQTTIIVTPNEATPS